MFKQIYNEESFIPSAKKIKELIASFQDIMKQIEKEFEEIMQRHDMSLQIKIKKGRKYRYYMFFNPTTPEEVAQLAKDREELLDILFEQFFKDLAKNRSRISLCEPYKNFITFSELVDPSNFVIKRIPGTETTIKISLPKERLESINARRKRYGFSVYSMPVSEEKVEDGK